MALIHLCDLSELQLYLANYEMFAGLFLSKVDFKMLKYI